MRKCTLSSHAKFRLRNRFSNFVTAEEIGAKLSKTKLSPGRNYVQVKHICYCEIEDPEVVPDGIARGDSIIVAVENNEELSITTIILRKSWSKSAGDYKVVL